LDKLKDIHKKWKKKNAASSTKETLPHCNAFFSGKNLKTTCLACFHLKKTDK